MGCDFLKRLRYYLKNVSIHAPAWGATQTHDDAMFFGVGFNPRTRMGCDIHYVRSVSDFIVSIHAPAWGATAVVILISTTDGVSIHAPAWGATHRP